MCGGGRAHLVRDARYLPQSWNGRGWLLTALECALFLDQAGALAFAAGDYLAAQAKFEQSLSIRRLVGSGTEVASSLHHLANVIRWGVGDKRQAVVLLTEALYIAQEVDDAVMIGAAAMPLGCLALDQQDVVAAERLMRLGLTSYVKAELMAGIPLAIEEFGALATVNKRPTRALTLFAAGSRLHRDVLLLQASPIRPWIEHFIGLAREAVDAGTGEVAWSHGEAMDIHAAISFAFEA